MFSNIFRGLCAGAAGSTTLNLTTYLDMLFTGRPASSTPEETVRRLAEKFHSEYFAKSDDQADASLKARRSALGVLLGYANGIGVAALAAEWRGFTAPWGIVVNGVLIGAVSMAASDAIIARLEISDPRTWTTTDWLRDAIPHLVYGLVTAVTLEALEDKAQR